MAYTVRQLAKLSGVSVRTLHFYDEIGLLKPAYYGDNKYRYYQEEQLLLLQQILFYREIGFPLHDIQKILGSSDFDQVKALQAHRKILEQRLDRTHSLIKTIDTTIAHLGGNLEMKHEELYYGFDSEKQKAHEKDLVDRGIVTQEFMDECNKKIKNWSDKEKNDYILEGEGIMGALIESIDNNLKPSATEVQRIMRKHYIWLERSWTPTKDSYIGLTQLYQTPEFRVFFDQRHSDLLMFIVEAMKVFAERELS